MAQRNLANLYADGSGVDEDLVMAATWYLVAQHTGEEDAADGLKAAVAKLTAKQWLQKAHQ